jgi:hypothetical protein
MEFTNGIQSGLIAAVVFIALLGFGWWFDGHVEEIKDDADGFTWLLVVVGSFVTIIGIGLLDLVLDWNAGFISMAAFASSGLFMSIGAIKRYIVNRRRLKELAHNDAAQTLAK